LINPPHSNQIIGNVPESSLAQIADAALAEGAKATRRGNLGAQLVKLI
jgi:hypothetical protein